MIKICDSEKETAESYFQNSIYINKHLGWLGYQDFTESTGVIWLDDTGSRRFMLAVQPAAPGLLWLHSFYADHNPKDYPLSGQLKSVLPHGRFSVYTISSYKWYSELLSKNGFRQADEIVQMETSRITRNYRSDESSAQKVIPFTEDLIEAVHGSCEQAYPPIWRLCPLEFSLAYHSSNYCRILSDKGKIIGYLLSYISDKDCDITRLAVIPEYQNRGMGAVLIDRLVRDCLDAGISSFSVNTNRNNQHAMHFYEKLNFQQLKRTYPVFHRYFAV